MTRTKQMNTDYRYAIYGQITSAARGTFTPAQPYYLMYSMKAGNKGLRSAYICTLVATEVVLLWIRSKIRYDGARLNDARRADAVETQHLASLLRVEYLKYIKEGITKIKVWGRFCLSEAPPNLHRTSSEATANLENRRKRHFRNIY